MAISTASTAYNGGYLVISYGTKDEVLSDLSTPSTYTGVSHREHIINFSQYDATHFATLYWRDST